MAVLKPFRFETKHLNWETFTHVNLMELKFDDTVTLLIALRLASFCLAASVQECAVVIKYASQSPPAVVVGISP